MAEAPDRCSFELNPVTWQQENDGSCFVDPDSDHDERILTKNADGAVIWRCPHEAIDGEDECMFHLSRGSDAKPNTETIADAFLEIVNGEREALDDDGPRPARFIGAEFESLDLDAERVGDDRVIDLRHMDVGTANWNVETVRAEPLDARGISARRKWNWNGVTFGGDALFIGAEFGGDARFVGSEFVRAALFREAEFGGDAWFDAAEFGWAASFKEAEFGGEARFSEAEFGGDARFVGSEFGGDARFVGSEFVRAALFREAEFGGTAGFDTAEFGGDAWFSEVAFGGDARFVGVEFGDDAWFSEAGFDGDAGFDAAEFDGDARFSEAEFGSEAWFVGSEFVGAALFREAEFGDDARFSEAEFVGTALFSEAEFGGDAWFSEAEFGSDARFDAAEFGGDAWFSEAEFGGDAWFSEAEFGGVAGFDAAEFAGGTWFSEVAFGGDAWFSEVAFGGDAWFSEVAFGGEAGFDAAAFGGEAMFVGTDFQDDAYFRDIIADEPVQFVDEHDADRRKKPYTFLGKTDFSSADIPKSEFSGVSFSEAPLFNDADLTGANLSDIPLDGASFDGADLIRTDLSESSVKKASFNGAVLERASLYGTDFRNARLYGARLAGAHISDHTDLGVRDLLEERTSLIPSRGPWPAVRYDPRNPDYDRYADDEDKPGGSAISDYSRAASVYAEIQRVAETNAASDLASRCFRWRKDMQRKRYASDDGRGNTRNLLRWAWAHMSNSVARYGDSPWRVVITSIVTIMLFGVLYPFFGGMQLTGEEDQVIAFDALLTVPELPAWMDVLLSNLYFSAVTFTTLGYGDIRPSGPVSQALASIESFLGAALLALLVAVLARRITR